MLFSVTRKRTIAIVVAIYFLGVACFVFYNRHISKAHQYEVIDSNLESAVDATRLSLLTDINLDVSGETFITPKQDLMLAEKLTEVAREKGMDYVYTLIERDGKIYFTSSSQTRLESIGAAEYQESFLAYYEDASPSLSTVFETGKPIFEEYTDKWGDFRTYFLPVLVDGQVTYVVAADISMQRLQAFLAKSTFSSLFLGLFLGLIALPLIAYFTRSVQREHEAEKIILYQDPITGLSNFNKLMHDIENGNDLKLLIAEIDNYSSLLNALGPSMMDHVVSQFISRLHLFIENQSYDISLYNVDSEKFALLTDVDLAAIDLNLAYSHLFELLIKSGYGVQTNLDVHINVRMGAAVNELDLFILAHMALEEAKKDNKSLVIYDAALNLPQIYLGYIEQMNTFHNALDSGLVKPFYQPIIDAKSGEIAKFECLARVVDEDNNVQQNPAEFMPIAYRSRLCHKLTRLMLDQTLDALKGTDYCVSINLSVQDIFDAATMEYIFRRLKVSGIAKQIEFEILEHEHIRDYVMAASVIQQLKWCGSRVGMDDLGKHYSNFDRLFSLPLDFVKIDGAIMQHIEEYPDSVGVAQKVIALAHGRDLYTVAEYCYNSQVYQAAVGLNVDYVQGFYVGKPGPSINALIDNHAQKISQKIRLNV